MIKTLLWENKENHSLESFNLASKGNTFVLEGIVILLLNGLPARITYKIECDKQWKTKDVVIRQEMQGNTNHLALKVDNKRFWRAKGSKIPFATGLHDIDLEITPATNALPVRRIGLQEGEFQKVDAVWVRFPSLTLEILEQRYTKIDDRRYRYESLATGYQAEVEVDDLGLVVSYDDLWRRVSDK